MLAKLRDLVGLDYARVGVRPRAPLPQESLALLAAHRNHLVAVGGDETPLPAGSHLVREVREVHANLARRYANFVHVPTLPHGSDIPTLRGPPKKIIFFLAGRVWSHPAGSQPGSAQHGLRVATGQVTSSILAKKWIGDPGCEVKVCAAPGPRRASTVPSRRARGRPAAPPRAAPRAGSRSSCVPATARSAPSRSAWESSSSSRWGEPWR